MASQQAATREKYGIDVDDGDDNQNRRPSFSEPPPSVQQQQQQQQHADSHPAGGTYGIWTSKPLVTMNMLTAMAGSRHAVQNSAVEVEPLPDGICVSRFGPISRKPVQMRTTASQRQSLQDSASIQGQHQQSDSRYQLPVLCRRICLSSKTSTPSYSSQRLRRCTNTIPASTPSLCTPSYSSRRLRRCTNTIP